MQNRPILSQSVLTFVAVCATLLTLPATADAQTRTLSWTETSTIEVPGTLGALLRAMPGALDSRTTAQKIQLQGGALIQQDEQSATIMDAEGGRFITIDHDAQTYMTFTFEESAQAAREMTGLMAEATKEMDAALDGAREERDAAMAELREAMEEARSLLSFRITTDRTGRTENFGAAGRAQQHFVTAELEVTAPPEGVEAEEEGGTLVFVMELWQSNDLPTPNAFFEEWGTQMAADPSMRALADDLSASAEVVSEAMAPALAMWDPRFSAGLAEVAEAVEQLEGTTVRSIVTVALVPLGLELDREELLGWEPESMGDRVRGEAAGAAREAAASAARGALGRLGRFGRGGGDEEAAPEEAERSVRPLFRLTTTKEDIVHSETGEDAVAALMQRIESYRQITMDDLMREVPRP